MILDLKQGRQKRDFLSFADYEREELLYLLDRAAALKADRRAGRRNAALEGKTVGLIFEKASTRTRVSFAVGIHELGAMPLDLPVAQMQIGRGEPISDSARVLSRYLHGLVLRTFGQSRIEEFARWSSVPVINGLSDELHPCQVLADLLTAQERLGSLDDLRVAWIGDGNNMAHSWIEAASILGFELRLACPEGYDPHRSFLEAAERRGRGKIVLLRDPHDAADGANVVTTDVWASMGQEEEAQLRARAFAGYRVDAALMRRAAADAIVLHCLPAHRGEEIDADVLEGPQSAVFDEAENRLHVQKAILEALI